MQPPQHLHPISPAAPPFLLLLRLRRRTPARPAAHARRALCRRPHPLWRRLCGGRSSSTSSSARHRACYSDGCLQPMQQDHHRGEGCTLVSPTLRRRPPQPPRPSSAGTHRAGLCGLRQIVPGRMRPESWPIGPFVPPGRTRPKSQRAGPARKTTIGSCFGALPGTVAWHGTTRSCHRA
jgi:hypothetical protein